MPDNQYIVTIGVILVGLLLIAIGIIINILSTNSSSSNDNPNNIVDCDIINDNSNLDNKRTAEILTLTGYAVLIIGSIIGIVPSVRDARYNNNKLLSIITLLIVLYKTIVTGTFYNKLIHHHVANEYYTYEGLSKLLLFCQAIFLCIYIYSSSKDSSDSLNSSNNQISFAIITLFLLNIAITAVTNNILAFFSTDG